MSEQGGQLPLLVHILRQPDAVRALDDPSWGLLIRQARTANVLGRTLAAVDLCIPSAEWPIRAQQAFLSEKNIASHRLASLLREVADLSSVLSEAGVRVILLKGAAYALDECFFAKYRHFGDVDILIPRTSLDEAERLLNASGWICSKTNPYDQQYYRRWMHELPPMQHLHRGTSLDVHHTILPLTARYKPNPILLFDKVRKANGFAMADVLSPADMFLHAAAHLFCEGEHENALRNLLDLHDLLNTFSLAGQLTVPELISRSVELDLTEVLALAARYLGRVFSNQIAEEISAALLEKHLASEGLWRGDWMFDSVFLGFHPSHQMPLLALARQVLYLRAHMLRMPVGQLAVHLMRKACRQKNV